MSLYTISHTSGRFASPRSGILRPIRVGERRPSDRSRRVATAGAIPSRVRRQDLDRHWAVPGSDPGGRASGPARSTPYGSTSINKPNAPWELQEKSSEVTPKSADRRDSRLTDAPADPARRGTGDSPIARLAGARRRRRRATGGPVGGRPSSPRLREASKCIVLRVSRTPVTVAFGGRPVTRSAQNSLATATARPTG